MECKSCGLIMHCPECNPETAECPDCQDEETLGSYLRNQRHAIQMSIEELARRISPGNPDRTIRWVERIEAGAEPPRPLPPLFTLWCKGVGADVEHARELAARWVEMTPEAQTEKALHDARVRVGLLEGEREAAFAELAECRRRLAEAEDLRDGHHKAYENERMEKDQWKRWADERASSLRARDEELKRLRELNRINERALREWRRRAEKFEREKEEALDSERMYAKYTDEKSAREEAEAKLEELRLNQRSPLDAAMGQQRDRAVRLLVKFFGLEEASEGHHVDDILTEVEHRIGQWQEFNVDRGQEIAVLQEKRRELEEHVERLLRQTQLDVVIGKQRDRALRILKDFFDVEDGPDVATELAMIEKRVIHFDRSKQDAETRAAEALAAYEKRTKEVEQLRVMWSARGAERDQAQREAEALKSSRDAARRDLDRARKELSVVKDRLDWHIEEVKRLTLINERETTYRAELSEARDRAHALLATTRLERDQAREEVERLTGEVLRLETAEAKAQRERAVLGDMRALLDAARSERDRAREEIGPLKERLAVAVDEVDSLRSESVGLAAELRSARNERNIAVERERSGAAFGELDTELRKERMKTKKLQDQARDRATLLRATQRELEDLRKHYVASEKNAKDLMGMIHVLEWRIGGLLRTLRRHLDGDDMTEELEAACAKESNRDAIDALDDLWRKSVVDAEEAKAEVERLKKLINTPYAEEFFPGVQVEAAHQVERWGVEHDEGKAPEDWLWLLGALAAKAVRSLNSGPSRDFEKAKHHIITSAAVLKNWYEHVRRAMDGKGPGSFQPGVDDDAVISAIGEDPDEVAELLRLANLTMAKTLPAMAAPGTNHETMGQLDAAGFRFDPDASDLGPRGGAAPRLGWVRRAAPGSRIFGHRQTLHRVTYDAERGRWFAVICWGSDVLSLLVPDMDAALAWLDAPDEDARRAIEHDWHADEIPF